MSEQKQWPETLLDPEREVTRAPWRVDDWVIYVNTHVAVFLPFTGQPVPEGKPADVELMRKYLATSSPDPKTFDLAAVRARCGVPDQPCQHCTPEQRAMECEDCDGEGEIECECRACGDSHDADCPACDGTGGFHCEYCKNTGVHGYDSRHGVGRLGRVLFKHKLLALLLAGAPGERVRIGPNPGGVEQPLLLDGDGWRGLLMPMRDFGGNDDVVQLDDLALEVPA